MNLLACNNLIASSEPGHKPFRCRRPAVAWFLSEHGSRVHVQVLCGPCRTSLSMHNLVLEKDGISYEEALVYEVLRS